MKLLDILRKLDDFGLYMEDWGARSQIDMIKPNLDNERVTEDVHQTAASTRDELIKGISDTARKARKADIAYIQYQRWQNGQTTAEEAIKAIGALYNM